MALAAALISTLPLSKRGTTPSLSRKYTYFVNDRGLVKISVVCSVQNILNTENVLLHHVSNIVISHLNVFRSVMKTHHRA
jgi:hypothetical protein